MEVGDLVKLNAKAKEYGFYFREKGPFEVASITSHGTIAIWRHSKKTGRPRKDYIHESFLEVVKEEA